MNATVKYRLRRAGLRAWRVIRVIVLALVTPLLEKGPALGRVTREMKQMQVPLVLSMKRVVVLGFAVVVARQVALAGVASWPEATLAIVVVLALPLTAALERVSPEETVRLVRTLFTRAGEGAARSVGSVYSLEPSKWDDHRDEDDTGGGLRPAAA